MKDIVIVGGGACGLMAAIILAKRGKSVTLLEKNSKLAKKIYASGNGKCNITNKNLSIKNYHTSNPNFVKDILNRCDFFRLKKIFSSIGIEIVEGDDGKFYPLSYDGGSVVKTLENYAKSLKVEIKLNSEVKDIEKKDEIFKLFLEEDEILAKKVLICSGSTAHRKIGVSDLGFRVAQNFNIKLHDRFPSLVQLNSHDNELKLASGVKIKSKVELSIDSQKVDFKEGDLLFTNYGLSGLTILDLSYQISKAHIKGQSIRLDIDLLPFFSHDNLKTILQRRDKLQIDDLSLWLSPIIDQKLHPLIFKNARLTSSSKVNNKVINSLVYAIKKIKVDISSPRDSMFAEVEAGGVDLVQSTNIKNLYFGGEVLDVVGDRGGYNLHFAFASGLILGENI